MTALSGQNSTSRGFFRRCTNSRWGSLLVHLTFFNRVCHRYPVIHYTPAGGCGRLVIQNLDFEKRVEIRKLAVETGAKCFTRAFLGKSHPLCLVSVGLLTQPQCKYGDNCPIFQIFADICLK